MEIVRAFTYVFDDPDWLNKIAITTIVTALSLVFTPLLVGLLGWAVLLGYMIELVRNVRFGIRYPLPAWTDFNRFLSSGANVLTAFVVYSLPNIVLGCISTILTQGLGGSLFGSTLALGLSCCLFPLLLIYNLIILPMLAIGMARYTEDPRINVFFEFNFLFETLRQHLNLVLQWWLAAVVANLVFFVLGVIPLLGWIALAALIVPVYGMLTGQFALLLFGGLKSKPVTPQPYRR